jgi:hypothetical protein
MTMPVTCKKENGAMHRKMVAEEDEDDEEDEEDVRR